MILAELMGFDFSTSGMTLPLLVAAGILGVGYFLFGQKKEEPKPETLVGPIAGLFSGSRLTMLASFVALVMQAGSVRDLAKKLLAKVIEFANSDKEEPKPVEPPVEEKK